MLLGFKRCFAPYVEDGSKHHTIRAKRKIAPRVGETCHCYVDPRQKTMRLLRRSTCSMVQDILVTNFGNILLDGVDLAPDERERLCWIDGFRPVGTTLEYPDGAHAAFLEYWKTLKQNSKKRPLPFNGDLIHWRVS